MYRKIFKRILDIILGGVLLVIFLIPGFIIFFLLRFSFTRPFYFQERAGYKGKIFVLYKFKTLKDVSENKGIKDDNKRVTKFGQFLRRTSLDELPQIFNVLKGDLSLVGPRPLLPEYLPLYPKEVSKRHNIKPGLTGLAQINGRNKLSWEQKFKYDLFYLNNFSFWLDMKIIFKTAFKMIVNTPEEVQFAEKYKGEKVNVR